MTTYTYNPITFNESDYTKAELHQLLTDILTGKCKPEFKVSTEISTEQFRNERYAELMDTLANEKIITPEGYTVSTIPVTGFTIK